MLNNLMLLIHILGFGFLMYGLGLELTILHGLGTARSTLDIRGATAHLHQLKPIMLTATAMIIAGGIAVVVTGHWGWHPWNVIALIVTSAFAAYSGAIKEKKLTTIRNQAMDFSLQTPSSLRRLLHDPYLHLASWIGYGNILGLLYVMVAKPNLEWCLWTLGIATTLGLIGYVCHYRFFNQRSLREVTTPPAQQIS